MATSRNLTHATITVKDGSGTPKTLVVPLDRGVLKWKYKREVHTIHDRKAMAHFARGRDQPLEVSLEAFYEALKGMGTTPTLPEALTGTGIAASAGWISTDAASGDIFTVKLSIVIAAPETGGTAETVEIDDFAVEEIDFEEGEDANRIMARGKARVVLPTATRP